MKMDQEFNDEAFDAFLREETGYIDDAGFTARVVQQLPAPRRTHRSLRSVILLGVALLASAIAYSLSGGGQFISDGVTRLAHIPLFQLLLVAIGVGLLVTLLGTLSVISKTDGQSLR